jgi:hypothetical protein
MLYFRLLNISATTAMIAMITTTKIPTYVATGVSLVGGGAMLGEADGAIVGGAVGETVGVGAGGIVKMGVTIGAVEGAGAEMTPTAVSANDDQ